MTGHLFIINGDLTKLACDAILIPTDAAFHITVSWKKLLRGKTIPRSWNNADVVQLDSSAKEPHIWLGNAGQVGDDSDFTVFAPIINEFVEQATAALQRRRDDDRIYAWPKYRLAVNVIGSGHGGARNRKGELVHGLLLALDRIARNHDVDMILVAFGDKQYAACQRARRQVISTRPLAETWLFNEQANPNLRSCARRLAEAAIDSQLVLFIGAGVSAGAGLPTWADLLRKVALNSGVEPGIVNLLRDKDYRDQATLLERWLGKGVSGLKKKVASELGTAQKYSLLHGLLASLPSREAVTTNFDQLFEAAATTGDRELAVLPTNPSNTEGRWLLKLHGSVNDHDHLILTRSDFLSMPRQYGALLGLVQGLLLMRHMLFVGYSLQDEDFHELMYEVRAARGDVEIGSSNATVLTLADDPLERQLWENDLAIVPMVAGPAEDVDKSVAARQLEIFLDLVGYLSTTSASFFLDPTYSSLSEDERPLRSSLIDLAAATREAQPGTVGYIIRRFLRQLGDASP
ncbi:SIR2 family protein [Mycobacterium kubicae]|uniref:SIR2 family protein n=1 Tax=Mycobacterium kubicae TaxID=120959 RepID=A0AAX1JCQ9_9MYCO|nr:SIR2 family protein [Mycobacterium kubicae]MCV7096674.1 SIR2 family protein [Mycobacterium kubicae]ORW04248.1 hypothetical protein AWC13_00700 [Mycobacterium kubicae]QNI14669.1 SIR2 family protein [Mycobacterium kubicae]QPI39259.1 SIR2 family protein [Mycobacterium kubicae]